MNVGSGWPFRRSAISKETLKGTTAPIYIGANPKTIGERQMARRSIGIGKLSVDKRPSSEAGSRRSDSGDCRLSAVGIAVSLRRRGRQYYLGNSVRNRRYVYPPNRWLLGSCAVAANRGGRGLLRGAGSHGAGDC